MDKKVILLIVAAICVALYFYGKTVKDNPYLVYLPTIGGLAFGLNTLINLAQ
jgi:sugar phosphate permease